MATNSKQSWAEHSCSIDMSCMEMETELARLEITPCEKVHPKDEGPNARDKESSRKESKIFGGEIDEELLETSAPADNRETSRKIHPRQPTWNVDQDSLSINDEDKDELLGTSRSADNRETSRKYVKIHPRQRTWNVAQDPLSIKDEDEEELPGTSKSADNRQTTNKYVKIHPRQRAWNVGENPQSNHKEYEEELPGTSKSADNRETTNKPAIIHPVQRAWNLEQDTLNIYNEYKKELPGTSTSAGNRETAHKRAKIHRRSRECIPVRQRRSTRKHENVGKCDKNAEQAPEPINEAIAGEVKPRRVQMTSSIRENKKKKRRERRRSNFIVVSAVLLSGLSLFIFINSLQMSKDVEILAERSKGRRALRRARMETLEGSRNAIHAQNEERLKSFQYQMKKKSEKFTAWFKDFCGISYEGSCFLFVGGRPGFANYKRAERRCAAKGAKVAHVIDEFHYSMSVLYLRTVLTGDWHTIWLGMKYDQSTGTTALSNGDLAPYVKYYKHNPTGTSVAIDVRTCLSCPQGMLNLLPSVEIFGALCEILPD